MAVKCGTTIVDNRYIIKMFIAWRKMMSKLQFLYINTCVIFTISLHTCRHTCVMFNKCIQTFKIFKLLIRTHNYIVCGIVECIFVTLDRRLTKFVYSMLNSRNLTVF